MLSSLNSSAVQAFRSGDYALAVEKFREFEAERKANHLTHPDLHVVYCNYAASLVRLAAVTCAEEPEQVRALGEEALGLVKRAEQHTEENFARLLASEAVLPARVMCLLRKGEALQCMGRLHEARQACEECLRLDPENAKAKVVLQAVRRAISTAVTAEPASSAESSLTAVTAATTDELAEVNSSLALDAHYVAGWASNQLDGAQITTLPPSSSIQQLKREAKQLGLPSALLSAKQAEHDATTKEALNFAVIRTDLRKPKELIYGSLADRKRLSLFSSALASVIQRVDSELCMDPRVLHLGSGSGVLSVTALRAGAKHVTAVDRWLYLAKATKDVLEANGVTAESAKVLHKKATDLQLHEDVEFPCNILLLDGLLDFSLLLSGLLPSTNAVVSKLLVPDAVSIPMRIRAYAQPVHITTSFHVQELEDEEGFAGAAVSAAAVDVDLSTAAIGPKAYLPLGCAPVPVPRSAAEVVDLRAALIPLGEPVEIFKFELIKPNDTGFKRDFSVQRSQGVRAGSQLDFNGVLLFYKLELTESITAHSWSSCILDPSLSVAQALQQADNENVLPSLGGCLFPVRSSDSSSALTFTAAHNTARVFFEATSRSDAGLETRTSLRPSVTSTVRDTAKLQAYSEAIARTVETINEEMECAEEPIAVLEPCAGSGVLSLTAAKRSAMVYIVQSDLHSSTCNDLRSTAAQNGISSQTTVTHRDAALLRPGAGIPLTLSPVNVAVIDLFDSGLNGFNVQSIVRQMELKQAIDQETLVIPYKAKLHVVGVEVSLPAVHDASGEVICIEPLERFLWSESHDTVSMTSQVTHRTLTKPVCVSELVLGGSGGTSATGALAKDTFIKLEAVTEGRLNAVAMWFELQLDEKTTLISAPPEFLTSAGFTPPQETDGRRVYYSTAYGQGLFYLDRALNLDLTAKFSLLARRESGGRLSFHPRPGLGEFVERPEFLEEWGGGVSVENPHVQRAKYIELLTSEFMQRSKSKRFPSVLEDFGVLAAQCGSLQLDPLNLERIMREMGLMEIVQQEERFSGLASVEAMLGPSSGHDFRMGFMF